MAGVASLQQPDWSYYRNTAQLQQSLSEWASKRPDLLRVSTFATDASPGTNSPPAQLVVLTDHSADHGDRNRKKLKVVFIGGEHGRELITAEVVQHFVEYLVSRSPSPLLTSSLDSNAHRDIHRWPVTSEELWISALLRNVEFHIVPCLGVWSRMQAETGNVCHRKNANDVDLNRNWDYLWNKDPSRQAAMRRYEQYRGPSAFSEAESRAVRDLLMRVSPDMYVNVHSGIKEMYIGWDHRSDLIPDAPTVLPLLEHLNHFCNCKYGGAGAIGGYVVYGGSMDYAYDTLNITNSITVEVYGGQGPVRECFAYFNPNTRTAFEETLQTWRWILMAAPAYLLQRDAHLQFPLPSEIGSDRLTLEETPQRLSCPVNPSLQTPVSVLCPPATTLAATNKTMQPAEHAVEQVIAKHDLAAWLLSADDQVITRTMFVLPSLVVVALLLAILFRCRSRSKDRRQSSSSASDASQATHTSRRNVLNSV